MKKVTHVKFTSLMDRGRPDFEYVIDTVEDFPGMFDFLRTQMRIRHGIFSDVLFEDVAERVYIMKTNGLARYLVTFTLITLVELK